MQTGQKGTRCIARVSKKGEGVSQIVSAHLLCLRRSSTCGGLGTCQWHMHNAMRSKCTPGPLWPPGLK